jgi:hypothetical protein
VISGARAPAGGQHLDRKTVTAILREDEERLVEIYSSAVTEGRVALKVRCGPPEGVAGSADLRAIDFSLAISRGVDDQPLDP